MTYMTIALLCVALFTLGVVLGFDRLLRFARTRFGAPLMPTVGAEIKQEETAGRPRRRGVGALLVFAMVAYSFLDLGDLLELWNFGYHLDVARDRLSAFEVMAAAVAGLAAGCWWIVRCDRAAASVNGAGASGGATRTRVHALLLVAAAASGAAWLSVLVGGSAVHEGAQAAPLGIRDAPIADAPDLGDRKTAAPVDAANASDWNTLVLPAEIVVELSTKPCVLPSGDRVDLPVGEEVELRSVDGRLVARVVDGRPHLASGEHLAPCDDHEAAVEITPAADTLPGGALRPQTLSGKPVLLQNGDTVGVIARGEIVSTNGTRLPQGLPVVFVHSSRLAADAIVPASLVRPCAGCNR